MTDRWFSPCSLVSSTNKTDSHDITEILLKVALNTRNHLTRLSIICISVLYFDIHVCYLSGNPWPPVVPKRRETKYFLTNILMDELRNDYERSKRSPLVNKILEESSTENLDIDSIQKQYVQENLIDNTEEYIVGSTNSPKIDEKKPDV